MQKSLLPADYLPTENRLLLHQMKNHSQNQRIAEQKISVLNDLIDLSFRDNCEKYDLKSHYTKF